MSRPVWTCASCGRPELEFGEPCECGSMTFRARSLPTEAQRAAALAVPPPIEDAFAQEYPTVEVWGTPCPKCGGSGFVAEPRHDSGQHAQESPCDCEAPRVHYTDLRLWERCD